MGENLRERVDHVLNAAGEANKHIPGTLVGNAMLSGLIAQRAASHAFPDDKALRADTVAMAIANAAGREATTNAPETEEARGKLSDILRTTNFVDCLREAADANGRNGSALPPR
jgi:hypothetical protein